jgi:hypothetical protein
MPPLGILVLSGFSNLNGYSTRHPYTLIHARPAYRAEHSANPRRGIWKRIRAFKFGFGDFFLTIFFAFANTIFEMIFKF